MARVAKHCCEAMTRQVNWQCDTHASRHACVDALIGFTSKFQEYALIIHDGDPSIVDDGSASGGVVISYCPWCGARLPDSQRDRWYDELERGGIDPVSDDFPDGFDDDRWLRSAQLAADPRAKSSGSATAADDAHSAA